MSIYKLTKTLELLDEFKEINIFYETMDLKNGFLRGGYGNSHFGIAYNSKHFLNLVILGNKDDLESFNEKFLKPAMQGEKADFYYEAVPKGETSDPLLNYEWIFDDPQERKESILSGEAYGPDIEILNFQDLKKGEKRKIKA